MRTIWIVALAPVALAACGDDRPVVVNTPPPAVVTTPPATVVTPPAERPPVVVVPRS